MAVSFGQIPADIRTPGTYLEIDPSLAEVGVGSYPLRGLILGQKIAAGTLAVDTPTRITSYEEAIEYAGAGSFAARMAEAWFAVNQRSEVDLLLVADPAGDSHTVTITFGGSGAGGPVAFYIGGDRYVVQTTDDNNANAAALEAVIDADPNSLVTASSALAVVTLTAKHVGASGAQIDVRHSHLRGERLPNGLTATVAVTQVGGGQPTLATALASMGSTQYDIIAHCFGLSVAPLGELDVELAARDDATVANSGLAFSGITSTTASGLAVVGDAYNSRYLVSLGAEPFPGVMFLRTTSIAALVARYGSADPGRPFQTLELPGFSPAEEDRFTDAERDLLLHDGISTVKHDRSGKTRIERLITMYQENDAGAPSDAFLDVNLVLLLSFFRKAWPDRVATRFPRHKLAADGGTPPAPGSALVTPTVYKAEAVAFYQELVDAGLCEDAPGFAANSTFEINGSDPNRLDVVLAPNFVNQLRVSATLVQFRL